MALLIKVTRVKHLIGKCQRLYSTSISKKGLVVGVYSEEGQSEVKLTPAAEKYNNTCNGKLLEHLKLAGNEVKPGKSFLFWGLDPEYQSVAVVGLGKTNQGYNPLENIDERKESIRVAASVGCRSLKAAGMKEVYLSDLGDVEAGAEGATLGLWKFQEYKTKKDPAPTLQPHNLPDAKQWNRGVAKGNAQNFARLLADTPANLMTPTIFAETVYDKLTKLDVVVQIRDKPWAENMRMGAFLSVTRGSAEPPKFLEIAYNPTKRTNKPVVLVGKGVTFDTGGISLKPPTSMDEMRADMGGAAVVVGAVHALATLGVDVHVKALIPLCENMPSGHATKPGDVVVAMNGKTICVDNTDAEGRLILADALCYSKQLDPRLIVDVATLTGAMRVALGFGATGVFSNSDVLWEDLRSASAVTGDRVWRFPLWKHYSEQVTGYDAFDVNNVGKGKGGGSCTAAAFLREFVPDGVDWMHLDIAGVMGPSQDSPYLAKGMTGRCTRTIAQFVEQQSK